MIYLFNEFPPHKLVLLLLRWRFPFLLANPTSGKDEDQHEENTENDCAPLQPFQHVVFGSERKFRYLDGEKRFGETCVDTMADCHSSISSCTRVGHRRV